MGWVLWLSIYCVPVPLACPAHSVIAVQPWYITSPMTQAQCEEFRALVLGQQPEAGQPRGFVLDAWCISAGSPATPSNLRLLRG